MDNDSGTAGAPAPSAMDPIEAGLRLFFVDVGISIAFFMVVGFVMLLSGFTTNDVLGNRAFELIGLLISAYAAFLLQKNYSRSTKALIAIIVTSVAIAGAGILISLARHEAIDMVTQTVSVATGAAAYCLGWYLAALTPLRIWLINRTWVTVFFWIGIASLVIGWL